MRHSEKTTMKHAMQDTAESATQKKETGLSRFLDMAGKIWAQISKWGYRLRKLILAIPVVILAVSLAINNLNQLPAEVGINLLPSGVFEQSVSCATAVFTPLVITGGCLVLMFFSRKVIFPWLISLFSLVLPLLILFMNTYPA